MRGWHWGWGAETELWGWHWAEGLTPSWGAGTELRGWHWLRKIIFDWLTLACLRVGFPACRTTRPDSILGLDKKSCSTFGFEQIFLFKLEKFVCNGLCYFEFGLFNPRVEVTNLLNSRVLFEIEFYDSS
jgi:hypothetical protein